MTTKADTSSDADFGVFALPADREALRKNASKFKDTRAGRLRISYYRKRAFKDLPDPFDVTIIPGVNARLWPRSNRCEKRAFAGQQVWDSSERNALITAMKNSERKPFIFLDVGANVGLYSLILAAQAKDTKIPVRILAIEPDQTNRARLEFNIAASNADIEVLPIAISDKRGKGSMVGGDVNRGEARLDTKTTTDPVKVDTLYGVCKSRKIYHVNAMKVDIEGYDLKALSCFFAKAPEELWPALLILETGRAPTTPLLELCEQHGYTITKRAGINSILERNI
ncbi:MAG: FkbM family methyltransferase [Acidimicrobiales bacterium]|nr:FkbM family methyltransferase [Hyphomonadaceae bacterium]RZV44720.1 MAG: FkbM family methyltransferase [Acidimicrobiales bacterium]